MTTDPSVLSRFARLATATVSDALESVGLPPGQGGFKPLWGQPQLVGFAATVQLEPITKGSENVGSHIHTTAIAEAGPEEVMVVANAGRTDVSCWGGLLSLGASRRGIRGVVADGACRDVAEARDLDFPVYGKASVPVTARGRLQQASAGRAVKLGAATVHPGDVVLADETGVAVVPRDHIEEVLDAAMAIEAREEAIAADVRAGVPLPEAMLDARLAGTNGGH
jgi:regulator of RNase E activity RraA